MQPFLVDGEEGPPRNATLPIAKFRAACMARLLLAGSAARSSGRRYGDCRHRPSSFRRRTWNGGNHRGTV